MFSSLFLEAVLSSSSGISLFKNVFQPFQIDQHKHAQFSKIPHADHNNYKTPEPSLSAPFTALQKIKHFFLNDSK